MKFTIAQTMPRKECKIELGKKDKKFTNVYIKNFGDDLTDDKLKEMFNKFGKITSYKVVSFYDSLITSNNLMHEYFVS